MLVIPTYLGSFSEVIKSTKNTVSLKIVSKCGNDEFLVYNNKIEKSLKQFGKDKEIEDFGKRCGWKSYTGGAFNDDKYYMYRKNIFGIIVDKVEVTDFTSDTVNIIKAKCKKCGDEYIVFDNRIHGWDAVMTEETKDISYDTIEFEQRKFKGSKENVAKIRVKVINQETFEEFQKENPNNTIAEYSNAFHDISIDGIIKDTGKVTMIHCEETA